jgi:hypothetical protein
LHAGARSLCRFLQREGLFDRQLQRAGGREMDEVADCAGNFGSAGPAAVCFLRTPDSWSRRIADIANCDRERRKSARLD